MALASAAHTAGFAIGVIDDRESFANSQRFPMAHEIYTSFEEAFEKIKPTVSTYMVIVTRGHKDDMRARLGRRHVAALHWHDWQQAQGDFGVSRARKGWSLTREIRRRACACRVSVGALTPEEIAISITAELIAIRPRRKIFPTNP